jgi:hypothetical protein
MRKLAIVLALTLAACANPRPAAPPPVPAPAPITTDRNAYAMRDELTIVGTFTAPVTAYITHCNGAQPMGLQRQVNGVWTNAWVAELNGCASAPIEVPAGKQHTAPLRLTRHRPIESGTYRVIWYGVRSATGELPEEQRVSAPVTIEVQPPPASTPPPPPPKRNVPSAHVFGRVTSASGFGIAHADVLVHVADAVCRPTETLVGAVTDGNGEYLAEVEGAGECVVVEAKSGGATGAATQRVAFAVESPRVRVDVRLDRAPALTDAEAERLVRLLADAINGQPPEELSQYVLHGPEALRVALEQYRTLLGGRVTSVQRVAGFQYALNGTSHVDVHQEDQIRLHSPLLDYGFRAERFMSLYLRAIASGDAEMLARVLNPDDVDFPVPRAREIIEDYRRRYGDVAAVRAEFVGVDERRNVLLWRLRGNGVTEPIELGFGDGLIGMRGL